MRTALIAMTVLTLPMPVLAQAGVVVEGRVIEAGGAGIQNATVELDGHSSRLTSAVGAFRFVNVEPGIYTLRVRALGYTPANRLLVVDSNVTMTVSLDANPLQLDPLVIVAPRTIDLEGRVTDPERDLHLMGADVLTNEGHLTRTNAHGRFSFEVPERVGLLVGIRAFGYLPLDTLLWPVEDEDYLFDLAADPLVERMIETEIVRLEDRARGRRAITMRPMNRERLLWYKGQMLLDVLAAKYPRRGRRISCVVFDEVVLSRGIATGVLQSTFVEEVERIEFLFGGRMLRVYTRDFVRTMLGGGLELRRPSYTDFPGAEPMCR